MFDRFVSAAGPGTVRHARKPIRATVLAGLLGVLAFLPLGASAYDGSAAPVANTEGSSRVVALTTGEYHSCGLKADGEVVCWGRTNEGQVSPEGGIPAGPYLSVTAGGFHSCGLKTDGSVDCWGNNDDGQLNGVPESNVHTGTIDGPYVSVSAGNQHSCGLKADGNVDCWGTNVYGQLDGVPNSNVHAGTMDGPYISVSVGYDHNCGVRANGSVDCWGANTQGKAADQAGPYVSVSAGQYHTCGLAADGSVDCWGNNANGQRDAPNDSFVAVSAGGYHTCGLKADGNVACWGYNGYGQTNAPDDLFVAVSAGKYHGCGLKADGSVQCWGAGGDETSGNPNFGQATIPATMSAVGASGFGQIAAGNAHACEVKRDGTLSCWGDNSDGQTDAPEGLFTQVVAGDSHSCAIGADGKITCWGLNGVANTTSLGSFISRQLAPAPDGAICALSVASDSAVCIRDNYRSAYSGFGFRNLSHSRASGSFPSLCGVRFNGGGRGYCDGSFDAAHGSSFAGPWQRLESGLNHQCGLKADGSIECWGDNLTDGQLDNMPASIQKFRAFSVGYNHACAIREDGTLACWGSNINGQTTPPSGTFVQVAAGNTFTCGIRDTGIRVCWGAGAGVAVTLLPGTLPNGTAGTAYTNQQFSLSGDEANLPANPVYAVSSGSLPPGLTMSANGLLSGTPTMAGTFDFSVDAEGDGDFGASHEYSITIADGSAPLITYTLNPDPADGDNGWYTGNVTVTWSVTDPESATTIDSGCGTGLVDTLDADTSPAGVTFSCTASSAGGSAGPVSVTLKRDGTDPTMSIAPASPANGNDWYNTDVSVLANCGDATPGSGVASCPSVPSVTAEGTTTVPAQTVQDNAGNTGSSNTLTINLDKTAPTVSAAATNAPDGSNGWYVSNVGVAFTCSDATSGIASCPANQTLSAEGSAISSSAQMASDIAGNSSAASNVVTVMIDKTAPTLAPTVPDPLLRDGSYVASPNASDATSGLANASCGPLDTSSTGSFSTTCSATDNAGNSNSVALSYTVSTTCANDGYRGTQLTWCKNICENGLTGATLDTWIHRWTSRYRDLPYCRVGAD